MGVALSAEPLSGPWVEGLVAASAAHPQAGAGSATVTLAIGKTRSATLAIVDGCIAGEGAVEESTVSVPVTADQLAAMLSGHDSMAQAYMRGDLKPTGAIGAFLPLVEIVEALAAAPDSVDGA